MLFTNYLSGIFSIFCISKQYFTRILFQALYIYYIDMSGVCKYRVKHFCFPYFVNKHRVAFSELDNYHVSVALTFFIDVAKF